MFQKASSFWDFWENSVVQADKHGQTEENMESACEKSPVSVRVLRENHAIGSLSSKGDVRIITWKNSTLTNSS